MKTYLINYLVVSLIFFAMVPEICAQIEEDSLVTEIDYILNMEIAEEKYIKSASKYHQTPEEAPSSISIITAKEIEAYGYESLPEILNAQKGIYSSNDLMSDQIGVRGFGLNNNNRILLLIDGHRLNPYQIDFAPIGPILGFNLSNFEKIEIVRGPGSTLYGSNAVHGVVNLITRNEGDSYIPAISLKYGSNHKKFIGVRAAKHIDEDLSVSLLGNYYETDGDDIYFREFDQPSNNNGIAENNDELKYSGLFLKIDYKDINITGMMKKYEKLIPTAPYNTEFNKRLSQFEDSEYIDLSWSPRISYDKYLIVNLSYDHTKYGGSFPFQFIDNDIEFIGNTNSVGSDVQFVWDISPNNRTIAGIEYRDNFNSTYKYFTGDLNFVDDKWSYKLFSIFFQNEYQYNADLSLYFGLRRDDFIGQEVAYNPRAGIVYSPFKDHTIKVLYGRSFRAPNLLERNLEEQNIVGFKKNELLTSEIINTTELIWNYSISDNLSSSMSLYYYNMNDLITQIEDPVDNLLQYVNIGEVNAHGVETEFDYRFASGSLYFRYSFQLAEDNNKLELINSPDHLFKFGVRSKIINILNGSFNFIYETKRKTIHNNYTDPILLTNFNLYTDLILDHFTLSFTVKNLINKTIKYPAGRELVQESIIQPYRNYLFTINFEL